MDPRLSRLGPRLVLMLFAVLLAAGIWGSAVLRVRADRESVIERTTLDAQNLARVFEEHTVRTFQSADQSVLFLKYEAERAGVDMDLSAYLKTGVILGDIFPHVSLIDEKGDVVSSSMPFNNVNLADREHIRVHFQSDTKKLYVSRPVFGRVSGKWSIQMTRRINKPDGSFGGVIVVGVDPFYFTSFYHDIDLGQQGSVTLVGKDSIVRARLSGDQATGGQTFAADTMQRFKDAPFGTFQTRSGVDGVDRIYAYRELTDHPFYVVVGFGTEEALQPFYKRRKDAFTLAGASTVAVFGFTALIFWMLTNLERSRAAALAAATQALSGLFEHMGQAFVAFGANRKVAGHASHQALALFGTGSLEGSDVRTLLYPKAPSYDVDAKAFEEWCALAFEVPPERWAAELDDLAPREAIVGPENKSVTLEFRPLLKDGKVVQVMLLATDVSVQRSLERAVETKEVEYNRQLAAMRRILAGGAQAFVSFVETARERLESARARIEELDDTVSVEVVDQVFRVVHTIRGEARAFDVRELEHGAEALEELLEELGANARAGHHALDADLKADLVTRLSGLLADLERGVAMFVEASPIGNAIFEQMTVRRSDLVELERLAASGPDALRDVARRLRSRPFGEAAAGIVESAAAWALSEGKSVRVVIERGDLPVAPELMAVLPGVLTHLVRNAIAHGIEDPRDREVYAKSETGVVRVAAVPGLKPGSKPSFIVEDDGGGVDEGAVRASAGAWDGEPIAELIFRPGVSTRGGIDALAGHGVGLDAVRHALAGVSYRISVEWKRGSYTRFHIRPVPDASEAAA